ncbi:hypothetical protein K402DRAFT_381914 [Aulographum hederae CBS 113979]|uniref:BTB domain-containing protein n=1 Tax=Aulographum hederae CBS 113979 TaxID=1176131 RepID=A0A6G1GT26_9PEZI|nr:hypothetical protein K402DRAFT_381914 [Aulographum hederae CBS 113979]
MKLLAPNGDCILRLDDGSGLRVSTLILSSSSEYFANLFSNKFSEGQNLDPDSPKEIAIVGDDPGSFGMFCAYLHHNNNDRPHKLSPDKYYEFGEFAVVAEKYQSVQSVTFISKHWGQQLCTSAQEGSHTGSDLVNILSAAYLLEDAITFRSLTKSIPLHTARFSSLRHLDPRIPEGMTGKRRWH